MIPRKARDGTQSIERTISVLKVVVARKEIGWRLSDIAARCNLNVTTTHRIVARLTAERLLQQRAGDRRYVPGPLIFELSLGLPSYSEFKETLRPELARMAKRYKGVAYLYLRSGDEAVCMDRVGAATVHPMTVVGTRSLITESTFGIAMLLAMARPDQAALIKSARKKSQRPADYRKIFDRVLKDSRRHGFGLNQGLLVQGLAGIAVPLRNSRRSPFAAIGVMGAMENYSGKQLKEIAEGLRQEASRIECSHPDLIDRLSP
jgi:DNA-binding IclR family transcriptional regulator